MLLLYYDYSQPKMKLRSYSAGVLFRFMPILWNWIGKITGIIPINTEMCFDLNQFRYFYLSYHTYINRNRVLYYYGMILFCTYDVQYIPIWSKHEPIILTN